MGRRLDQRAITLPTRDDDLVFLDRFRSELNQYFSLAVVESPVPKACLDKVTAHTARLLEAMRFTGIAEVEYKWNSACREYKLIEIGPRPWDQHRLGKTCGVDLIYLSYCEHAGLPRPASHIRPPEYKWVAEDRFVTAALSMLWRRNRKFHSLFSWARGKRIYAIWSARDPLPLIASFSGRFMPPMLGSAMRVIWSAFKDRVLGSKGRRGAQEKEVLYGSHLENEETRL